MGAPGPNGVLGLIVSSNLCVCVSAVVCVCSSASYPSLIEKMLRPSKLTPIWVSPTTGNVFKRVQLDGVLVQDGSLSYFRCSA